MMLQNKYIVPDFIVAASMYFKVWKQHSEAILEWFRFLFCKGRWICRMKG